MPSKIQHFAGERVGRLVLLEETRVIGWHDRRLLAWVCKCDCGKIVTVTTGSLFSTGSRTSSCGCFKIMRDRERELKHGHSRGEYGKCSSTYKTWLSMHGRCRYPDNASYPYYGGRGISVCERWGSFEVFLSDMGERPVGMTIDRKNNDGNYEPSNCQWATRKDQYKTRSTTRTIQVDGTPITIRELADRTGVDANLLRMRILSYGWTVARAVSQQKRAW